MKTFVAAALASAALLIQTANAQVITMTITVTNRAVTSNSFTANGSVRVFTNVTSALTVATNLTSVNATKTNLFNQIAAFPITGVTLMPDAGVTGAASNIVLRSRLGGALSGSITGISASVSWGLLTLSTQTGPSTFTMLYPGANIVGETNRTNQASDIVAQLNTFATNFFNTNSGPLSNFLSKGASPLQTVTSPVLYSGGLRASAAGAVGLTNGYTSSVTNINSVSSNHVNFGNAIRSEGLGGNSLQVGSNALAKGDFSVAVGNSALASNANSLALGTSARATNSTATAAGASALAGGDASTAVGSGAEATMDSSTAIGESASATAQEATAVGRSSVASGTGATALGTGANAIAPGDIAIGGVASGGRSLAVGLNAQATHTNSSAIGTVDSSGTSVGTTTTNQNVIGTALQRLYVPGTLSVNQYSNVNTMADTTNLFRGAIAYPHFSLSTIANGNNISIPLGSNRYVRLSGTVTAAPTLCGFIGGATSGGIPGQEVIIHNDLGFSATFAQNTVDPVPANRIETVDGSDVTVVNNGWALLEYSGADSRWHLAATYPVTAMATNAIGALDGTGTNVNVYQTAGKATLTANAQIGNATNITQTVSTNGTVVGGVSSNNTLFVRALTGSTANPFEVQTTNGAALLSVSSNHTATASNVAITPFGVAVGVPHRLFVITNDIVITNTLALTSCLSNLLGTRTIPANFWKPGMSIEVDLFGKYFGAGSPVQTNGVYFGASLLATNLMTWSAAAGDQWESHFTVTCRTTGASGSLYCQGFTWVPSSAGGSSGVLKGLRMVAGAVTVDTTADTDLDYKFLPSATTTALHIHAGTAKVTP